MNNLAYKPLKPLSEVTAGDKVYLDKGDGSIPTIVEVGATCRNVDGNYEIRLKGKALWYYASLDWSDSARSSARIYPLAKFEIGDECRFYDHIEMQVSSYIFHKRSTFKDCKLFHNPKVYLLPVTFKIPEAIEDNKETPDGLEWVHEVFKEMKDRIEKIDVKLSTVVVDKANAVAVVEPELEPFSERVLGRKIDSGAKQVAKEALDKLERHEPKAGQVWECSGGPFMLTHDGYVWISGGYTHVKEDYSAAADPRHNTFIAHSIEEYYTKRLATPSCKDCACSSKSTKQ